MKSRRKSESLETRKRVFFFDGLPIIITALKAIEVNYDEFI